MTKKHRYFGDKEVPISSQEQLRNTFRMFKRQAYRERLEENKRQEAEFEHAEQYKAQYLGLIEKHNFSIF